MVVNTQSLTVYMKYRSPHYYSSLKHQYVYVKHSQKYNKVVLSAQTIGGTYLQCVNNHYAKFEYKGMKTVGVTDYRRTGQTGPTSRPVFCQGDAGNWSYTF